jgi:hypothetical protein
MSKKLIISEQEKNHIKNLYNINEIDAEKFVTSLFTKAQEIAKRAEQGQMDDDSDDSEFQKDSSTTSSSSDSSSSPATSSDFIEITKDIIRDFEGGYWNPKCARYPETRHPRKEGIYSKSSETMFGLDREAGNIEAIKPEGEEFFRIIDKEKKELGREAFCKKWVWNYDGGDKKEQLMDLAARVMKKLYDKNANNYFKDPEVRKIVESSKPLILHFSYATWNGPGFFKDFAESITKAVKEGKTGNQLVDVAISDRNRRFGSGGWAQANQKVTKAIDAIA